MSDELDQLCINTIRFLSVDPVQKAKSGHPGMPLGAVRARLAVKAGAAQGWHRYVGDAGGVLSGERFGASAPRDVVQREYGFNVEEVCKRARALRH